MLSYHNATKLNLDMKLGAGQHGNREFSGWSNEKCESLIARLTELVRDELTEGIATHLPYTLYQDEYIAKLPPKMPRTSQYGICFLATLERCLHIPIKQKGNHRLSLVIESGHKNSGNAREIFDKRQALYRDRIGADALRKLTFASKQDSPELMASDFLAHTIALAYRRKAVGLPHYTEMADAQPRSRESGLTFQEITPKYLQAMRDEFEKDNQVKREEYLRRKQVWLDARKVTPAIY